MAHIQDRRDIGRGWIARYRAPDGKEKTKSFERKADTENWLALQTTRKATGEWVDPAAGRITFKDWAEKWWPTQTHLRSSSAVRDEAHLNNHVIPAFGSQKLVEIRQEDIAAWVASLTKKKKLAPATVRLVYAMLSKPLDAAVDARRIASSPCRRIKLPRIEASEMRFLDAARVDKVAGAIDPYYSLLVYTAVYAGMRWGELAGLKPARVDPLHRTIRVEEQLIEVRGKPLGFGPPKTAAGRRTIRIPKFLADMLTERIGTAVSMRSGLVFPVPEGMPMRASNFRRLKWHRATKAAGVEGLRFHDLRHTAVALAIQQGAHPKAIQQRLGHSTISQTMDRYGHLFPNYDDKIADGLDDTYTNAKVDKPEPPTELTGT